MATGKTAVAPLLTLAAKDKLDKTSDDPKLTIRHLEQ